MKRYLLPLTFLLISTLSTFAQSQVFPFHDQLKWGIVDEDGELILEPQYQAIWFFMRHDQKEALAAFQDQGKWGLLSRKGKIVLSAQYDEVGAIIGEQYFKIKQDESWALLNIEKKRKKLAFEFDSEPFPMGPTGDFICISQHGKKGLWSKGSILIEPKYEDLYVRRRNDSCPEFWAESESKAYCFDCSGTLVRETELIQEVANIGLLDDGMTTIESIDGLDFGFGSEGNDMFSTIRNKLGRGISFGKTLENIEGKKFVIVYQNRKYGISDPAGNLLVPMEYGPIRELPFGYQLRKGNTIGLFSLAQGKQIVPCEYANISQPYLYYGHIVTSLDYLFVTTMDGQAGYFHKQTGKLYLPRN
jgi:hypothetical protein